MGAAAPAAAQVIEHVTVIDGRGGPLVRDAVVIVEDGRIRAVGPRASTPVPRGIERVDGKSGYLLPGFIDVHVHVTLGPVRIDQSGPSPVPTVEPDPEGSRRSLALLLAHGITTIRDPGGAATTTVAVRDSVARGLLTGPRMFVAGEAIDKTRFAGLTSAVATPDEVRREVRRQAAAGVDLIKLYAWLTPDLVGAGVEEAHTLGLPAVAHLMFTTWTDAARMGLDGIVHILGWSPKLLPAAARPAYQASMVGTQFMYRWLELVDLDAPEMADAITAVGQRHMSFDPTLVVFERAVRGDDPSVTGAPALAWASPVLVQNWRTTFSFSMGWSAEDFARARVAWPKALRLAKLLYERGALITAGTDANNPWTVPGESFHRELELLVEAGIPPLDVISIATRNGAQSLGTLDQFGTVEAGKRADLVLVRDNPLASISATRTVAWVMKDGVMHEPTAVMATIAR
jgi:imidazolonepropionase-like amidohydrolase